MSKLWGYHSAWRNKSRLWCQGREGSSRVEGDCRTHGQAQSEVCYVRRLQRRTIPLGQKFVARKQRISKQLWNVVTAGKNYSNLLSVTRKLSKMFAEQRAASSSWRQAATKSTNVVILAEVSQMKLSACPASMPIASRTTIALTLSSRWLKTNTAKSTVEFAWWLA